MAIRRVTGAVSPSELIFADANALGATYDGSGTTIERGETFTLPAGGTTAVSNGALRLEALKGDCTITNNGNSTLTNASGVDGTIVMRSGASDFPAFVRNSSMGSMSIPAREDFTGDVSGTINSNTTFPAGHILQVVQGFKSNIQSGSFGAKWADITGLSASITPVSNTSKILVTIDLKAINNNSTVLRARCLRNNTDVIGAGDTASNRPLGFSQIYLNNYAFGDQAAPGLLSLTSNYLDSPNSAFQQTYKVQIGGDADGNTYHINHTARDTNGSYTDLRSSSSITLMEITG